MLYCALLSVDGDSIVDFMTVNLRYMALPNYFLFMSLLSLMFAGILVVNSLYNIGLLYFVALTLPILGWAVGYLLRKLVINSFISALDQIAVDSSIGLKKKKEQQKITDLRSSDLDRMMEKLQEGLKESVVAAIIEAKKKKLI
jgi:hypothetical protein